MIILSTLRAVLGSIYARATGASQTSHPRIVTANAWTCSRIDASAYPQTFVTASAWANTVVSANAEDGE